MATKKISELPLVNRVSGSQVAGGSVLPIVIGGGLQGTTNQISVEDFSIFVNAYNAHTGAAGNIFTGPQTINNNVIITGKLTVNELVATYETASIIYSEGGNIFGNELIDKQQFTGSSNFTGSVFINGQNYTLYSSSNSTVFTNFSSSNSTYNNTFSSSNASYNTIFSSSNAAYVTALSSSNSAYNTTFSSSNSTYVTALSSSNSTYNTTFSSSNATYVTALSSSNSSYNTTFSSSNSSYNTTFSSSNSSYNTIFSSSNATYVTALSSSNSSYNTIFSSSNSTTITALIAGTNSELARVYQATASIQFQTASLLTFTASQDSRNFTLSQVTGSFRGEIGGLEAYSASLKAAAIVSSSTQVQNYDIFGLNSNLYRATGSLIGITNGLMAFTAALDNTYATDAQLYQLYQSTRSLELHSGSMVGVTNGLMAYTASNSTLNTGLRGEVDGIEAYTASLKGQAIVSSSTQVRNYDVFALNSNLFTATGSLIGITNGLMAFTAALDSTYATDAQLFQLYQATRSIELTTGSLIGITNGLMALTASMKGQAIVSSSTQVQNYDVFALNSNLYTSTGSLIAITNELMALTASMKGQAIVSSSQQIQNYFTFARTGSANTFYDTQTISGSLKVSGPLRGNIISGGLDVNGGVTGSFKGNLAGVADYAATVAVSSVGTTTDTSLFPTFTTAPVLASYTSLYSHASSSFFLNGVTRRVHMEGFVVSGSNNIAEISGSLNVSGSINVTGSVTINESRIDNGWTAYTPQWTAASSNPVINNGTIEGYYKVIGKTCFVRGNIAMGSTTTFGTGEWYVSMPFTASHADGILMTVTLLDNGSGWYNATMAGARAGFNHKAPIQYQTAGGTAGDINATAPFTWASTDRFMWNGSYEIA